MKLLMITRCVDKQDAKAGFVFSWIVKMAEEVDELLVVSWQPGTITALPKNVKLFSLTGLKFFKIFQLQKLLLKNLSKVSGVFCHMMVVYAVLVGPLTKFFNKKLVLWYAHGGIDKFLKIADLFVDDYVTSSASGFRFKTKKEIHIIGQAIDINKFKPAAKTDEEKKNFFEILTVGRISPAKNINLMIELIDRLKQKEEVKLKIIGGPGLLSQASYMKNLQQGVTEKKLDLQIDFLGPVIHEQIIDYLQSCHLFLNLSTTGSLDKAVLEAMACEKLVLTTNEAYKQILPEQLFCSSLKVDDLQKKIEKLIALDEKQKETLTKNLREEVIKNHNLDNFVKKIVNIFV